MRSTTVRRASGATTMRTFARRSSNVFPAAAGAAASAASMRTASVRKVGRRLEDARQWLDESSPACRPSPVGVSEAGRWCDRSAMPAGAGIRVVLADDDPRFLEALAVALEADGRFEVVGLAGNGAEAFQLGCWQEPDVVVMDVEMPVIDGIEAARLLRQSRARACVLMVSGGEDVVAHRMKAGAAAFVSKTDFDTIPDVLAQLAGGGAQERCG